VSSGGNISVAVVIPAYDCADTIGAVTAGARRHASDVVVVSDGSRDDTADVARSAGGRVEVLPENRGKGVALRRGVDLALERAPNLLVLMDADGQHDPDDLPALIEAGRSGKFDLIVGSRLQDAARIPGVRYWTNYIGTRALTWMTGYTLLDSQSGYRLMTAELARRMSLRSSGYAIETEMLIKAAKLGARLGHVRVRTIYNSEISHFEPFADTIRILLAAIQFQIEDLP
jgi:glycosyltransferase involved in cell wall biosynthesis